MTEAHRLNMVGGHFIWLWIDTSTSTGYFHQANVPQQPIVKHQSKPQQPLRESHNRSRSSSSINNNNHNINHKSSMNAGNSAENRKSSSKANNVTTASTAQKYDGHFDDAKGHNKSQSRVANKKGSTVDGGNGNRASGEDQSKKSSADFSEGFDPFLVLQRQDEHLKQTFGLTQHYQDRTMQRDNKQTPANRLILGLRDEDGATETTDDQTTVRSKKTRRSPAQENFHEFYYDEDEIDADSDANEKRRDSNISAGHNFLSNQMNASTTKSISSKYRNFSDDNLDDFIDNNDFNEYHNNNNNNNNNMKWNFKRTSTANGINSSSYVNFYQFKDFPVGLLALRPIRMNVDRHFIRAACRVFAATWKKINGSNTVVKLTPPPPQQQQQKPTLSTQLPQSRKKNRNAQTTTTTTVLYNAKKSGNEMQNRKIRRRRNIYTVDNLLMKAMEKRAMTLASATAARANRAEAIAHSGISDDVKQIEQIEHQTVPPATMQVNSSLFLEEFSDKDTNRAIGSDQPRTDDIEQSLTFNRSFTSDLPINNNTNNTYYFNNSISLTELNVSFNRNFSGLLKQNSKFKSNIHSLNGLEQPDAVSTMPNGGHKLVTSLISASTSASSSPLMLLPNVTNNQSATQFNHNDRQIELMAKQASQSVVGNFFDIRSQDIRFPFNKRQNAWWSSKKEAPPSATQLKRPQYDVNNTTTTTTNRNSNSRSGSSSSSSNSADNSKRTNQLANVQHSGVHDSNQIKCETPSYFGGCYGTANATDIKNAEYFAR